MPTPDPARAPAAAPAGSAEGSGFGLGILAGLGAATIWGLNPLYFSELSYVPPVELLSHRIFWGAIFVLGWCLVTGRMGRISACFTERRVLARLALSAGLITVNWLVYLIAVQAGRVAEAGLGYYMMPLISVALGVLALGERLDARQWAAVGLAGLAVALLVSGVGPSPLVPLTLAMSFSLYGLVRKRLGVGAITGFAVEVALLAPLAVLWMALAHGGLAAELGPGESGAFGRDSFTTLMLIGAGPLTGLPLILFAEAARRLPYATVGLVQYANPTLQVGCAVLILGESVGPVYLAALALVWAGLALYTSALMRRGG